MLIYFITTWRAITTKHTDTYGDVRSPIRDSFQRKPENPVCLFGSPGFCRLSKRWGRRARRYVAVHIRRRRTVTRELKSKMADIWIVYVWGREPKFRRGREMRVRRWDMGDCRESGKKSGFGLDFFETVSPDFPLPPFFINQICLSISLPSNPVSPSPPSRLVLLKSQSPIRDYDYPW